MTFTEQQSVVEDYYRAVRCTTLSARLKYAFAHIDSVVAADTETTGLVFNMPSRLCLTPKVPLVYSKPRNRDAIIASQPAFVTVKTPYPFGISLAFYSKGTPYMVWARHTNKPLYEACKNLLASDLEKTWHNYRYDLRVCKENGISIGGKNHCTLTMSRIWWDRRKKHELQRLCEFLWPELSAWEVDLKKEWTKLQSHWTRAGFPSGFISYSFFPDKLIGKYSQTDSFIDLSVFNRVYPDIAEYYSELYTREMDVLHCILSIEQRGLAWDIKKAKRETKKLETKLKNISKKFPADFNPNSPAQVLAELKKLGVKDKDLKEKGKATTGADKLRELLGSTLLAKRTRSFIENLLLHRAYSKTVSTYLKPLTHIAEVNNGTVYTTINPSDTRTGRMASRGPNLQNIPTLSPRRGRTAGGENPVRGCFTCRRGYTNYFFDYSNMEMVVFGGYTGCRLILDTYNSGGDIHGAMTEKMDGPDYTKIQRDRIKDTNYGVLFGMGPQGMAKARGVSVAEAKDFLKLYSQTFPEIHAFQNRCKYLLQRDGFVQDWFGKRYHIPYGDAYKAVNALIQGVCASVFKVGLLQTVEYLSDSDTECNVILPIHDEIMIETPIWKSPVVEEEFTEEVIHNMTNIPQLLNRGLKLRVSVKKSETNWAEKKAIEL